MAAAKALFLDELLACGFCVGGGVPPPCTRVRWTLFAAAHERGMRLVAGKVLMDRHAPTACATTSTARADNQRLIARWHGGHSRLSYAVTVRFAPAVHLNSWPWPARCAAPTPRANLQTHVAENRDGSTGWRGCSRSAQLPRRVRPGGPAAPRDAVLAHGIWLGDTDRRGWPTGAHIAFCPSGNLFLGSGLFDWRAALRNRPRGEPGQRRGRRHHLSMLRTLAAAYQVQALRGERLSAWCALHAATRGAHRRCNSTTRSATCRPARWPTHSGVGLGQRLVYRDADAVAQTQSLHARDVRVDDAGRRPQPRGQLRGERPFQPSQSGPTTLGSPACFASN